MTWRCLEPRQKTAERKLIFERLKMVEKVFRDDNRHSRLKDYSYRKKPENTWNAPGHGEGESAEQTAA